MAVSDDAHSSRARGDAARAVARGSTCACRAARRYRADVRHAVRLRVSIFHGMGCGAGGFERWILAASRRISATAASVGDGTQVRRRIRADGGGAARLRARGGRGASAHGGIDAGVTSARAMASRVTMECVRRFGVPPERVATAPGRVNLIGEHTDYNDGFVLPMAIDREIAVAVHPRTDDRIVAYSVDFEACVTVSPADRDESGQSLPVWARYVRATIAALERAGHSSGGADLVIGGNVPVGAGLSSSAALCVALIRALTMSREVAPEWSPLAIAQMVQTIELGAANVRCGV